VSPSRAGEMFLADGVDKVMSRDRGASDIAFGHEVRSPRYAPEARLSGSVSSRNRWKRIA